VDQRRDVSAERVEPPAMRLVRVRFTIRRMMIVVLVAALACGWVARQLRRQALLAAARAQGTVTNDMLLCVAKIIDVKSAIPEQRQSGNERWKGQARGGAETAGAGGGEGRKRQAPGQEERDTLPGFAWIAQIELSAWGSTKGNDRN
jgi:hypothetical protein